MNRIALQVRIQARALRLERLADRVATHVPPEASESVEWRLNEIADHIDALREHLRVNRVLEED